MKQYDVLILRTGTANIASISSAFERLGTSFAVTDDAGLISTARSLVLPGVGAFSAAMEKLRSNHLVEPVKDWVSANRPFLAICLGLQLLCEESEESPGVKGLSILPCKAVAVSNRMRVPHMGWNSVVAAKECCFLSNGYAYFANSFCIKERPQGWRSAITAYDGEFVSAVEKGNLLACQFHPELSGSWGIELIKKWLEKT